MPRQFQSIDAMPASKMLGLKIPDAGVSCCTMDEKEGRLSFRPLLSRDNHMNSGSVDVQIHGLLNDLSGSAVFVRVGESGPP